MKEPLVAVTTRVDIFPERGERRDALDQRMSQLISSLGGIPIPVVNNEAAVKALLEAIRPAAIILSGGNDLDAVGGDAPERDSVERSILGWANYSQTPVVGICRGMQMIAVDAGASLRRSGNHVCDGHTLYGEVAGTVPSHHVWCLDGAPSGFSVLARAGDDTCEAFLRDDQLMLGLMWHPERIVPFRREDVALIKSVLRL